MAKLIYAADDDKNIRELLKTFLESEGYSVRVFETGDLLLEAFNQIPPDIAILDIMMPGTDGLTLCAQLRRKSKVPIILLTAKDTDSDQMMGIAMGSDDYLTKPFRPTLLNLRVKAILRRIEMERGSKIDSDCVQGDLKYEADQKRIVCAERDVNLTMTELSMLLYLMRHANCAISRETLLNEIWGFTQEVETRVTDETLRRIRKKLMATGSTVRVSTIWGYGYKLEAMREAQK